ncbi:MAG: rhamnulokinase [Planctomycetales bacterium]|nr:rhamnulokinase [Planctomycetales bacterium]
MSDKVFLAVDLGAESGRVMAGRFNGSKVSLEQQHRFGNGPVQLGGTLRWNLIGLWKEIQEGLRLSAASIGKQNIASVGVDTWGVDFVLMNRNNELLGQPWNYRDSRTEGMLQKAFQRVPRAEIFAQTGLQFMQINSLYQLLAMCERDPELVAQATQFLMIPDFFHWCLCGSRVVEFTNATTTQMLNAASRQWAFEMLRRFDVPTAMFPQLVTPGTVLGNLRSEVGELTGLGKLPVVTPATHDTGSAVAAVPTANTGRADWAYISSGTWSLMGVEVPEPVTSDTCASLNFTNEGGVGGSIRLLKNIAGLWLIQECRRVWKQNGREFSWDELVRLAESAPALQSLINPDDPRFGAPSDMPATIRQFCSENGEPTPDSEGAVIRCALESLALRYRQTVLSLEKLTDSRIDTIHIVGGGTQNKLLSQMTADACNRRVVAGPVEATAIGNIMMQAVAHGDVAGIEEARQVVARSFPVEEFCPKNTAPWDDAFQRFQKWM